VISLCGTIADQASTLIVASVIALSLVTPLSVAARLIAYASALLVAASDVITPLATGLHADGDRERQKILLLESAKRCTALAIVIGAGLVFLGGPFLALWIGHQSMPAWRLLPVMVVGSLLPISQRPAYSLVLAAGKHKILAISAVLENAVAIPLALLLAPRFGMFGVCACFASAAVLNQLAFHMYTGCALTHISVARCVWETMALPAAVLAAPVVGLAVLVAVAPPGGWVKLSLDAAVFFLACLGAWNAVVLMKRAAHFIRAVSPIDSAASAALSVTVD
jgi:O-antigen/teichoic acid export membrane protein